MSTPFETSGSDVEAILHAVRDHTHALLGRTITYSAEDWAAPSRLPGWTRSHVAAHLIQGARTMTAACRAILQGQPVVRCDPALDTEAELLALADGLQLQIELDTSAGELDSLLAQVVDLEGTVNIRGGVAVAYHQLPLVRLRELVLHTFDLEPNETELRVDPAVSLHLLALEVHSSAERRDPVELVTEEGFTAHLGEFGQPRIVQGSAAELLAWLARDTPLPESQITDQ